MRFRIVYWIFCIALLWIVCALFFNYFYQVEKANKIGEAVKHQKTQGHLAAKNFEQLFSKWNNVLYYLAKDENIIKVNAEGKDDMTKLMGFLSNEVKAITRTDSTGKIIFTYPDNSRALGSDISKQKHMVKIIANHQPVVSDVFETVQGFQAIVIHYPIFGQENYLGTIALLLDFEKLSNNILSEIDVGQSGMVWMISSDGFELFCKTREHIGKPISEDHRQFSDITDSMLHGKQGASLYDLGGKNRSIVHYQPLSINNTFWALAVSYSESEVTASLIDFRRKLLLIFGIVFLLGVVLSYYVIRAWVILRESELRKIAESRFKESEEKYRRVVEATDTGYAITDREGKILDANVKFSQMTGNHSVKKLLGKPLEQTSKLDNVAGYLQFIERCFIDGTVHHAEVRFHHSNGIEIPVEISACRITIGEKDQVIMLCRNISERIQAEEELAKERTLLRTLIDSLPSGVFIKDTKLRKIIANNLHIESVKGHMRRNGLNADIDILGKTDFEVFLPEEANRFQREERKIIETGKGIINNVESGWGPTGEKIWLLVSKLPIKTPDGTTLGIVGITTDITPQKAIEEQLIIEKEKAEQSDKLKTAFLNNISHEIRTPLNAIVGFSSLMCDPELTSAQRENYHQIVTQSSQQLLMIITDIINIATIEAGHIRINKSQVKVNPVLDLLYQQHAVAAEHKKLKFEYTKGLPDETAVLETDETKFIEILSNLITNALKFTDNGTVSFGYTLQNGKFTFFVTDTGIGIMPENHHHIFDRFWQVENAHAPNSGGTGLGLSISKTYVELLGGEIWLKSEPGKGTAFYFTLPFRK